MPARKLPRRLEYVPIDDLPPDPRNPKGHDGPFIRKSVGRLGYIEPVILDERTGQLIAGHGRREQLTHLFAERDAALEWAKSDPDVEVPPVPEGIEIDAKGRWQVPVVRGWASKDDDEAAAALVALNRGVELGGWIRDPLAALLEDIAAADLLDASGFGQADLDRMRAELADPPRPDEFPPADPQAMASKLVHVCPRCSFRFSAP